MITAPACSRRSTTVALYGGTKPARIFEDAVVGTPRVHMLSLIAIGTPCSGPGRVGPLRRSVQRTRAIERALGHHGVEGGELRLELLDALERPLRTRRPRSWRRLRICLASDASGHAIIRSLAAL